MSNQYTQIMNRRTFAIISHPDAGKTTVTEQLLYLAAPYKWQEQLKLESLLDMRHLIG